MTLTSKVIDGIIYGAENGRMLMIISDKYREIAKAVHDEMERGSTLLKGVGTYTNIDRPVLICAINIQEFQKLKRIIYEHDENAFVISIKTDEVFGEGFTPIEEQKR